MVEREGGRVMLPFTSPSPTTRTITITTAPRGGNRLFVAWRVADVDVVVVVSGDGDGFQDSL